MTKSRLIKNTFETLGQTVEQVMGDVAEQITGDFKELPLEEKKQIQNEEKVRLQRVRQNLVHQMEVKKPVVAPPVEDQQKKQIKEIQKQKKKDNALQRLINMTKGSQERKSGDNVQ